MSTSDFMKGIEKAPSRGDSEWARAIQFKRSAFRNGWTTFNVREQDADEAERRLTEHAPRPDLLDCSGSTSEVRAAAIREAMAAIAETESRKQALEIMEGLLKP